MSQTSGGLGRLGYRVCLNKSLLIKLSTSPLPGNTGSDGKADSMQRSLAGGQGQVTIKGNSQAFRTSLFLVVLTCVPNILAD